MNLFLSRLDEDQHRWLALESQLMGWGAIGWCSRSLE
jgi:hypothetical protein